jgi:hypothetical protein
VLAIPEAIAEWSLTTLREKQIKIGAKVVSHGRYVAFQMAEVAIPRKLFAAIVERITSLRIVAGLEVVPNRRLGVPRARKTPEAARKGRAW